MKRAILTIVLALALIQAASALSFDFKVRPVNDSVFGDERAVFFITVYNQDTTPGTFEVAPDPINWVGTVDPNPVEIPGFGSRSATIYAKPKSTIQPGSHAIPIKVTNLEELKSLTKNIPVYIKPFDPKYGWYFPSIALGTEVPAKIDPRTSFKLGLYMRNRNQLNITELQVSITSPLFGKTYTRTLEPLLEDREEYIFEINDLQQPGMYPITVELLYDGKTVSKDEKTFEVEGYTVPSETKDEKSGLFTKTTTYTVSNKGNTVLKKDIMLPDNIIQGIFSQYSDSPTKTRENGDRYLLWATEVEPQTTYTLTVTRNYQLAVALLVILLLVVITYATTRSPIALVKEAKEEMHEGHKVVKVRVLVRNRSGKSQYKIVLKDRVPPLAVVIKRAHVGTLQPSSVRPDRSQGTILTWELDVLEPHEERLVAYIIQTRLKVLGGFTLRPARVSFQYNKREKTVRSNQVLVRHQ